MKLPKPQPLKPEQLQHPHETTYKAWNGDERKKGSNRWNGQPDMEDRGFASRGVTVTDGTRPQSNVRPVNHKGHAAAHAPLVRDLKPTQDPQVFKAVMRPAEPLNIPELTARQAKLLRKK